MISAPRPRAVVAAVTGLLLVAALGLLVERGATLGIDLAIIRAVRDARLVAPLAFLQPLTELGSTSAMVAVAVLLLVVELLAGRPRLGLGASLTLGFAALLNGGLKRVVDRARPDLLPPIVLEPGYSFPSGHAMNSIVAYGIVALVVMRHERLPRWLRAMASFGLGMLVAAIGISRVYLGVHFPSDVLGGWLLGGVIVLLFASMTRPLPAEPVALSPGRLPAGGAAAADRAEPRSGPPAAD